MRRKWKPLLAIAVLISVASLFEAWLGTCGFAGCPTGAEIRAFQPSEGGRILDRAGAQIGQVRSIRRVNVTMDDVPEHVRQAFLATEDRRFYDHGGVDLRGVVRATIRNVAAMRVREGFSTITMQVARNTFIADRFPYSERSLRKKLLELRVAAQLERHLEKDEIFALYLNAIYLGNGTYGVEAASRDLFGRSVTHLTPDEGAMLAALPKGPTAYTPRRDKERAKRRRDLVLGLMANEGFLDSTEARRLQRRPLEVVKEDRSRAGYGNSYALDAVRAFADSVLGTEVSALPDLIIYTTIDQRAQRAAERAVARQAAVIQRRVRAPAGEHVEGAMVAIDPATGGVLALVGGREYVRRGFNRAIAAKRQPGSAFKPFVYSAALEAGFTTASMVEDAPISIEENGRIWQPANADGQYMGRVSLRRALARSSNTAAVRLTRSVGEGSVVEAAQRNGIRSTLTPVPAIALGALEVTPLELVSAYVPFANGGTRIEPHLVTTIETAAGRVLWEHQAQREVVMDPRDAFLLTSMLRSVVDEGTAQAIRGTGGRGRLAGKTGTTNDGADVWFVGYTPTVVAGVWFGFDKPRSLGRGAGGGSLAAPAFAAFYQEGWAARDNGDAWETPDGMVRRVIDPSSGLLAGEWCPNRREEWFKEGTEPTSTSDCDWYWEQQVEAELEASESDGGWFRSLRSRIRGVFGPRPVEVGPVEPPPPPPPPPVSGRGGAERDRDDRRDAGVHNDGRRYDDRRNDGRRNDDWRDRDDRRDDDRGRIARAIRESDDLRRAARALEREVTRELARALEGEDLRDRDRDNGLQRAARALVRAVAGDASDELARVESRLARFLNRDANRDARARRDRSPQDVQRERAERVRAARQLTLPGERNLAASP